MDVDIFFRAANGTLSLYNDYLAPVEWLQDESWGSFHEVVNRHKQSLGCLRIRRCMCLPSIVRAIRYISQKIIPSSSGIRTGDPCRYVRRVTSYNEMPITLLIGLYGLISIGVMVFHSGIVISSAFPSVLVRG